MAVTTHEALDEWSELIDDVSGKWGDMMDVAWLDLPPTIADCIIRASHGFADAAEAINEALIAQ